MENSGVDSKGGKCRSGKCRSDNVWKAVRRSYSTQYLTKSTLFSAKTSRRTYIKTGNINALFNALYCCNNTRTVSRSVNIAHELSQFPLLHFPPLRFSPAFSTPAISTLVILSVPHFPLPHFQWPRFITIC